MILVLITAIIVALALPPSTPCTTPDCAVHPVPKENHHVGSERDR